ncbi:BRCT domain-containing protein [Mycena chlorophos]|uniref:BRCT domain-containing protein n=1 Tax=Mycena chlorophos TaxID=658473 RepID=A0A8H6RYU2_MYCCL|nr:BRCT domain-containing protein [Mycena chlorophos]
MIFKGLLAFFSASVLNEERAAWLRHGGDIVRDPTAFTRATVFFAAGIDDPMLPKLLSLSVIVRHSAWISKCLVERFPCPVSKYILDDQFTQLPAEKPQPRVKRAIQDVDASRSDSDIIDHRPLKKARISSPTLVSIQPPSALPSPLIPTRSKSLFPFPAGPTKLFASPLVQDLTKLKAASISSSGKRKPVSRHPARPAVLRFSIDDLVARPRPVARQFVLDEKFQEKVFSGVRVPSP